MKFYAYGKKENPVILLLPGTCCHWKLSFGNVIPLLEDKFYVVCASYNGFDETEETIFSDMISETELIEEYIKETFEGKICAAYGCSMGGSFVGLLVQRGKIHIEHAILGSSDLDQESGLSAKIKALIVSKMIYGIFQKGRLPAWMRKWIQKRDAKEKEYYDKMLDMFGVNRDMTFVKKQSVYNQFYYDLITPLQKNIFMPGTLVHCFYATKMGEKYFERYNQHFKNPDIRHHNMQHEELLVCYPEKWVEEIECCCLK